MSITEAATAAGILLAIATPTVGWVRERGRDKVITRRAEIGADLDVLAVARGLLEEQRTVHFQEVALLRSRLEECLESRPKRRRPDAS